MFRVIVLIGCLMSAHYVWAAGQERYGSFPSAVDALGGGIVTDQTITPAGHDFYQQFSALWYDKPLQDQFSIAVREKPSAREGNRIQVEYANRVVFEAVLPTARGNIAATADRAVDIVYEQVSSAAVRLLLFHEADLAADEF